MEQALLLNASYEPLKVVHWQKAITLWCQGKVEVIAVHDREIRAVSFSVKLPSVIRLLRFVRIKRQFDYVPFSRANIYARDHHTCQYCHEKFPTSELTFDHVVPVAHGGRKDWENIVTCCVGCNRRKGGRTPGEALHHRRPREPGDAGHHRRRDDAGDGSAARVPDDVGGRRQSHDDELDLALVVPHVHRVGEPVVSSVVHPAVHGALVVIASLETRRLDHAFTYLSGSRSNRCLQLTAQK